MSQKHEGGVWALLEEADKTAEEKKRDEGEVYEAMADSLSHAWTTLISLLERRGSLLQLASEFFDRALEVQCDDKQLQYRAGSGFMCLSNNGVHHLIALCRSVTDNVVLKVVFSSSFHML